jgi:hypothetical protein
MNVREAYKNFITSTTGATLFKELFVLAASAHIRFDTPNKHHTA